ncbi:MAG: hypothetical protein V2A59_01810 [Candidatus Omnitrophota bacterium]
MIKKIIILGLVILVAFIFYKKFMADTLEPFFRKHSGNVDLLGIKTSNYEVNK